MAHYPSQEPSWPVCAMHPGPTTECWALSALVQYTSPQARAELASAKRLLARSWWLTCLASNGTCGATHKASLRCRLTILHRERTRGLSSTVERYCRLLFPTLCFLTFKNLQHFSLFHFSLTKLSRLFSDSSHFVPQLGKSPRLHSPFESRYFLHLTHNFILASLSDWNFHHDHISWHACFDHAAMD